MGTKNLRLPMEAQQKSFDRVHCVSRLNDEKWQRGGATRGLGGVKNIWADRWRPLTGRASKLEHGSERCRGNFQIAVGGD